MDTPTTTPLQTRSYERELRTVRIILVLILTVAFTLPTWARLAISALAGSFAFIHRHHLGWRWVLLPAFCVALFAASLILSAVLERSEKGVRIVALP